MIYNGRIQYFVISVVLLKIKVNFLLVFKRE